MWLDLVAAAVALLFVVIGALRGGLASGLALASLGVAYGAALWAGPRWGPLASGRTGVSEWLGVALAGSAAFLVASIAMGVVTKLVRRFDVHVAGVGRSPRDRFLGAVFGGARGALVVLLLSYVALWGEAARSTGAMPELPELGESRAARVTEHAVEAGMTAMVSDATTGRVFARIASRPGRSIAELRELMEHPVVAELRGDAMFWTYLEHGSVDAALNRRGALALVHDGELRRKLGDIGLIDEAAVEDARLFREAAAEVLREVGPRIRGLKEDPELQALMRDPDVVAAVQSGDHFALMGHPGFRAVVARVMENE